jgi:hypothetical protein
MSPSPLRKAANKWSRRLHRWGAILAAAPVIVIICTGLLLNWKKEVAWIQPAEMRGAGGPLSATFDQILAAARAVPEAHVESWDDIDRLDVRPGKGIVKVQCRNHWELQVDTASGAVLSSQRRRSDLIESIHDGSFFHKQVKHWVFFPAATVLLGLWLTGLYLWVLPIGARRAGRRLREAQSIGPRSGRASTSTSTSAE